MMRDSDILKSHAMIHTVSKLNYVVDDCLRIAGYLEKLESYFNFYEVNSLEELIRFLDPEFMSQFKLRNMLEIISQISANKDANLRPDSENHGDDISDIQP